VAGTASNKVIDDLSFRSSGLPKTARASLVSNASNALNFGQLEAELFVHQVIGRFFYGIDYGQQYWFISLNRKTIAVAGGQR
jgi:hypothetical protein